MMKEPKMKTENNGIRAIETRYRGCLFRSRLEARWAVFYDSLGIEWRYEPEGFNLGELGLYLPDFWLPQLALVIEIKPHENFPTETSEKVWLATKALNARKGFIFYGDIPKGDPGDGSYSESANAIWSVKDDESGQFIEAWDCGHWWCECPECGRFDVKFNGRADRINCDCPKSGHGDKGYNSGSKRILHAYEQARAARFEKGERLVRL
jgi:hypothetical protein